MEDNNLLVNRVASSSLLTLNLEEFYPHEELMVFDMKDHLFMGLILKEKDFRAALAVYDWAQYTDKNVAIHCSADAIVPYWAYMLVSIAASAFAKRVICTTPDHFVELAYETALAQLDVEQYRDKRIVIKGCSKLPVPISAYVRLSALLAPVAKSMMYGEPCSTVPLYKKK